MNIGDKVETTCEYSDMFNGKQLEGRVLARSVITRQELVLDPPVSLKCLLT